ncbi:MAG TPA: Hpt domain-containing protein, partial [Cellvibrio sp.]
WGQAQHQVVPLVAAANPFDILRRGGMDTERALHNLMQNQALYRRLLERFARERAGLVADLRTLITRDRTDALNQVHSLKSLAGSLGMNQLEQLAQQLEQQLREPTAAVQADMDLLCQSLTVELQAMIELVQLGLPAPQ